MRYLLDTHAFLWFVLDDKRISTKAKSIIKDSKNEKQFYDKLYKRFGGSRTQASVARKAKAMEIRPPG